MRRSGGDRVRNSRGRNFPDVAAFAARCLKLGAHGITLHPRPDQRHARDSDVELLKQVCDTHGAELNVEGYPSASFLGMVSRAPQKVRGVVKIPRDSHISGPQEN